MSDFNKLDANRIVTDIAIKDGRIMDAVNLAKRGVQLVLAAATHRQQEITTELNTQATETFTTTTETYSGELSTTTVCGPFTPTESKGNEKVCE